MISRPVLYAITMAMSAMTASAGPCSSDPVRA